MPSYRVAGPCVCAFGTDAAEVSLGVSKDGFTITPRVEWLPIISDSGGDQPVDYIFGGHAATLEFLGITWGSFQTEILDVLIAQSVGEYFVAGMTTPITAQQIQITESDGSSEWIAPLACPLWPTNVLASASVESAGNLQFLIVPDANFKLFTTIPTWVINPA